MITWVKYEMRVKMDKFESQTKTYHQQLAEVPTISKPKRKKRRDWHSKKKKFIGMKMRYDDNWEY